jgi:predicted  nucleic acid-binding Zn-ribbon protein
MVTDLKKELVTKSGELAHLIEERDGFVTQRTTELEDMKRTEDGLLNTVSTLQDEMTTKGDQLVMLSSSST